MVLTPLSLNKRIFLLVLVIVLLSIGFETFFLRQYIQDAAMEDGRKKIMKIAETVAADKRIIAAFKLSNPATVIQPIAENIRTVTDVSYVVVMNMEAIRYSHPEPDYIGKRFIGGDETEALKGARFISQVKRVLGISQRAFVPVMDDENRQIGVVSVGLLLTEIEQQQRRVTTMLYTLAVFGALLGVVGAAFLSRNIKKAILGLEPYEIAAILEERNVILSSIREGVIAIDPQHRIILMNDTAKRFFSVRQNGNPMYIRDILPTGKTASVMETRVPIYDEEHVVNETVILMNQLPLISGDRLIGAVVTFRDMGDVRRLAGELTEVRKYIDLLRQQHHEYLNRLHVISGLLQLREYQEAVHYISSTVSQKQKTSDFLRARIRDPLVSGLLFSKIDEAGKHGIMLAIEPDSTFPKLQGDTAVSVIAILGNILENAIESLIASTSVTDKRIDVAFIESGQDIRFVVHDNGAGFPEDEKEKVFEAGYTTKSSLKNMGMGLFIVRKELAHLNGSLAVSIHNGVEFTVIIPKSSDSGNLQKESTSKIT